MVTFEIRTPPGFTVKDKNVNMEFKFNPGFGGQYINKFYYAQEIVDSEVLRYDAPYVPFDTGQLNMSGTTNTFIGRGEVAYRTPYARRWYYTDANFQGAPMRGKLFFERMKVDHKRDILKSAGEAFE